MFFLPPQEPPCGGYLYEPCYSIDRAFHGKPRPYLPQPGDVMLATNDKIRSKIEHNVALAFEPHHSAIIFNRPDGTPAILEAGPFDTFWINVMDLSHLKRYEEIGPVWIRQRKTPLTKEQSECLTAFCMRQDGKRFALGRLALQWTPLRPRGLLTAHRGRPHGDRNSYYCAELVMEACVAAGLVDAATARPSATYPHDMFFDKSLNPYINKHLPLACDWEPPAQWVSQPCQASGATARD
jgi:hypothetical protein